VVRQEWQYARQHGVPVFPVKGVPDAQIDYAALPSEVEPMRKMPKRRFSSRVIELPAHGTTMRRALMSRNRWVP
jgi:hypothetical protein